MSLIERKIHHSFYQARTSSPRLSSACKIHHFKYKIPRFKYKIPRCQYKIQNFHIEEYWTLFGVSGARPASRYLMIMRIGHFFSRKPPFFREILHYLCIFNRKIGKNIGISVAIRYIWQDSSSSRPLSLPAKLKSLIRPFRSSIVPLRPSVY